MCHAADGSGNTPAGKAMKARPFNSPDILKESDADSYGRHQERQEKMPAFAGKLTDAQITDVVAYIHTLQKKYRNSQNKKSLSARTRLRLKLTQIKEWIDGTHTPEE